MCARDRGSAYPSAMSEFPYGGHFQGQKTTTKHVTLCISIWEGMHLLLELEHKALWVLKKLNLDLTRARDARKLQLNELIEWLLTAYENAKLYKERSKQWHDSKISKKDLTIGQWVLLLNFHFHLFPSKLKSRWSSPFIVREVFPQEFVELINKDGSNVFKVNGQRVMP
ncbi:uncharacterized protein LOC120077301 [Benincasa hispida]|uniref:uncharacterized protein LOC120077301 n=1 Tax=Benincasa hispida TaxID=102211 RepID=UPI0018FF5FF1|nr:uncharacterized protein LOC120077301 [Benincasa hispida]